MRKYKGATILPRGVTVTIEWLDGPAKEYFYGVARMGKGDE
jgi:hypothetical protein